MVKIILFLLQITEKNNKMLITILLVSGVSYPQGCNLKLIAYFDY